MLDAALSLMGAAVASYGRRCVSIDRLDCRLDARVPSGPVIFIGWHEANLIAIAVHRLMRKRPVAALVPAGLAGRVMRGWLIGAGVAPVAMKHGQSRSALSALCLAIEAGHDVVIAVDGPEGPAHKVQDGAVWIARRTGAPLIPAGFAATPRLRLPRWDGLVVPLPWARTIAVMGKPINSHDEPGTMSATLRHALDDVTARACLSTAEHKAAGIAEHAQWN